MSHTESRSRSVVQSINFELLAVPEAVLSHIELRSRSAVQSILCVAPRCPRGSLVPYKGEEQITCPFHSLCCSSLSQRQSRPIRKRGADQLCSSFSVLLLAIPEAVSSHTKVRSISSAGLSLRRELCAGWPGLFYKQPRYSVIKVSDGLWKYIQSTVNPKPEELES